jgi:hypothetical protein
LALPGFAYIEESAFSSHAAARQSVGGKIDLHVDGDTAVGMDSEALVKPTIAKGVL